MIQKYKIWTYFTIELHEKPQTLSLICVCCFQENEKSKTVMKMFEALFTNAEKKTRYTTNNFKVIILL